MKQDYQSSGERWNAVLSRDARADSRFFYAVKTTGVFCRPSCKARTPKRENVSFFDTAEQARDAGFRACKRCKPEEKAEQDERRVAVLQACRQIEGAEEEPSLKELAEGAGYSPSYFNKLFKSVVGVTPKQYAIAHRSKKAADLLQDGQSVTETIYDAGFGASSRYYEVTKGRHGMTGSERRKGGEGIEIRYAFSQISLGTVIVAATEKGICSALIGDDQETLLQDLTSRFPRARFELAEKGSEYADWVKETAAYLDDNRGSYQLPLDVRGTAFQERVWRALQEIPAGETASYTEIAERIGAPKSMRAVAGACAANPVAIVIPCHRVLRADGGLSGYRWGRDRKRKLLQREAAER